MTDRFLDMLMKVLNVTDIIMEIIKSLAIGMLILVGIQIAFEVLASLLACGVH